MMGKQHSQFNIFFGILLSLVFICVLGFGPQYLLVIPIAIFTATLPDIDQARATPRRWKALKLFLSIAVVVILIISVIITVYYGYNIFTQKMNYEDAIQVFSVSFGVLIFYWICFRYLKGKEGKFLTAHRGFTHILIIPIILVLVFIQLDKLVNGPGLTSNQKLLIQSGQVLIAGLFTGITGHIFLDLTCKAGVKILWPLYRQPISIGNAITSDPKNPRRAHPSSIITTYIWSTVCIILSILIIYNYRFDLIRIFKF